MKLYAIWTTNFQDYDDGHQEGIGLEIFTTREKANIYLNKMKQMSGYTFVPCSCAIRFGYPQSVVPIDGVELNDCSWFGIVIEIETNPKFPVRDKSSQGYIGYSKLSHTTV